MDGDRGTVHGREALRAAVAGVWAAEPSRPLHLTLKAVVDPRAFGGRPEGVADPVSRACS
jgi:hypothetical protein